MLKKLFTALLIILARISISSQEYTITTTADANVNNNQS